MSPSGKHLKYVVEMDFGEGEGKSSNNTAEYEGLLASLRAAARLGIRRLIIQVDCQLVINQVNKEYDCPQMEAYVEEVRKMEHRFDGLRMEHIPRGLNSVADELSKIASRRDPVTPLVFIERITRSSIPTAKVKTRAKVRPAEDTPVTPAPVARASPGPGKDSPGEDIIPDKHLVLAAEHSTPPWAMDILRYVRDHILPEDDKEAERVARQAKMYTIIDGDLYRRRASGVKL